MNFSIVIPTYNRAKHLNNCLSSLLIQTKKPFEILVVDQNILDSGNTFGYSELGKGICLIDVSLGSLSKINTFASGSFSPLFNFIYLAY